MSECGCFRWLKTTPRVEAPDCEQQMEDRSASGSPDDVELEKTVLLPTLPRDFGSASARSPVSTEVADAEARAALTLAEAPKEGGTDSRQAAALAPAMGAIPEPPLQPEDVDTDSQAAAPRVDTAVQTEALRMPLAPLPICYPMNLIHAQTMLAISLNQEHQLDLKIAHLRLRLCEQEVRAATALIKRGKTAKVSAPEPVPQAASAAVAEVSPAARETGGGEQVREGAPEAGRRQDPLAQVDQVPPLRRYRRRIAAALRIALVLMMLELRAPWFLLCMFVVVLYICGLFDRFIDWLQRPAARGTLEQQLVALRNRQQRGADEAATAPPVNADAAGGGGPDAPSAAEPRSVTDNGAAVDAGASVDGTGAGGAQGDLAAAGGIDVPAEAQPPWSHRFFYQLVVMFFLTLLPWWTPNPRYL